MIIQTYTNSCHRRPCILVKQQQSFPMFVEPKLPNHALGGQCVGVNVCKCHMVTVEVRGGQEPC